jgi:recombination protein RecA
MGKLEGETKKSELDMKSYAELCQISKEWGSPRRSSLSMSTSTGIIRLDAALGGRLPTGAVEIYGEASTGKTTLLYEIIATAQKSGMQVALCPTEYLDIPYMGVFGIDLDSLVLITGNSGEGVLGSALEFLDRPNSLVALDSATNLRPSVDSPGRWIWMLDTFLEQALHKLHPGSCVVATNQVRTRRSINPDQFFVSGQADSTAKRVIGRFSTRLELSRGGDRPYGHTMSVNIVANTASKPSTVIELPVKRGAGVDTMRDLLMYGLDVGVVSKAAAWFYIGDKYRLGNGVDASVRLLEAVPEISGYLLDRVMMRA